MFKNCRPVRLVAAAVLLCTLSLTAIGQQTPQLTPTPSSAPTPAAAPAPASTQAPVTATAPAPTPQMIKVMRSLSSYEEGTKLDIRLTDGSHQIGRVGETRSTDFVFVDSVSGKARNIDYLDVEGMRATGKGALARQLHKSVKGMSGAVVGLVVVCAALGVIALISFHK